MTENTVTLVGTIGREPERRSTAKGDLLKLRVASSDRVKNADGDWVDGPTSWYSVSVWDRLARHAAASLHKGERIVVHGVLKVTEYETKDGARGTDVDVKATSIGHDLLWGTSSFTRGTPRSTAEAPAARAEPQRGGGAEEESSWSAQPQLALAGTGDVPASAADAWASPMAVPRDADDVPF